MGLGFGVWGVGDLGLGHGIKGLGFRAWAFKKGLSQLSREDIKAPGVRPSESLRIVQGSRFRVQGCGFEDWGLGFRVQDLGFRVEGLGLKV